MAVVATVGMSGLRPVMAAIEAGKTIALANKESLVAAGALVTAAAARRGVDIRPIDSEHSAVWQCLRFGGAVRRILLTASGGPFFGRTRTELRDVTPEQAVRHPNWNMGQKISVDSATMMNKGLEIIEARWLFGTETIDYIVHRESIVHSMVEFVDGTIAAALSYPSMDIPIQLALGYPDRLPSGHAAAGFFQKSHLSAARRADVPAAGGVPRGDGEGRQHSLRRQRGQRSGRPAVFVA